MHADARNLLWDARQAAERVARFTHGKTFGDYQTDELLRSAVERQFEIVGEALNQLSRLDSATAAAIPDLPRIVGFPDPRLCQRGQSDRLGCGRGESRRPCQLAQGLARATVSGELDR